MGLCKIFRRLRCPVNKNVSFKCYSQNVSEWYEPSGTNTGISVYNCITKKKVPLILQNNLATWYSCGPTVYDISHIGHASCYVKLDIIQRILTDYFKINLITSMGVTDVDDKIIKRSKELAIEPKDLAVQYELEFWKNMNELGITMPNIITRVTEHIPTITNFIQVLMDRKVCYKTPDNSVYFDTMVYGKYGKLQHAQHGHDDVDNLVKKSPADFALWKGHKSGEPFWESPWGNGRPGWHIECSAMVSRLFGNTVDFHAGGVDLLFPHHENEETQSCAYHGHNQWVSYWLHTGHLQLKGDVKMSKSLKNTISIDDLLKTHKASTFRMACLLSHYRYSMEYNEEIMTTAKSLVVKFKSCIEDCNNYMNQANNACTINEEKLFLILKETKETVEQSLRNDFDTSSCLTALIKLASEVNKMLQSNSETNDFKPLAIGSVAGYIKDTLEVFGLSMDKADLKDEIKISDIIDNLVKFRSSVRNKARETKDKDLLAECDNVRNILKMYNIKINDNAKSQSSSWIYTE